MNSHNSQKVGSNRGRREGIYNRTGEPSVTFCEKEQQRECALVFYKKSEQAMHSLLRRGGEGMGAGQGVESTQRKPWADEYDPDCPTELLVDVEEVAEYEFNYTAIQKWLPWVEVNV